MTKEQTIEEIWLGSDLTSAIDYNNSKTIRKALGNSFDAGERKAMEDELDFLTHIIWGHDRDYNEFPDAQITDGALMISAISPFAKKVTARIEKLKDTLGVKYDV